MCNTLFCRSKEANDRKNRNWPTNSMIEYALKSLIGDNSVGTVTYFLGRWNKTYEKIRPFLRSSAELISTKIKGVITLVTQLKLLFIFLVFYVSYFVNHIQLARTSVEDKNDKVSVHFSKTRSEVQKPPSQLRFSLASIIVTISNNEPWNIKTHKTDLNPQITNHNFLNTLK